MHNTTWKWLSYSSKAINKLLELLEKLLELLWATIIVQGISGKLEGTENNNSKTLYLFKQI